MRNICLLISALFLIFTARYLPADEDHAELRPGMELKKIGGINAVVPEGSEIYEKNGLYMLESPEEYAARRFKEMESRFFALEEVVLTVQKKIKKLKEGIENLEMKLAEEESGEILPSADHGNEPHG